MMNKICKLLFGFFLMQSAAFAQVNTNSSPWEGADTLSILIPASPDKGFNFPYLLKLPTPQNELSSKYLLVETNNTGRVSDSFMDHLQSARTSIGRGLGASIANSLSQPFLMPVFPRSETTWTIYTHAFDRDSAEIKEGSLLRLDLQLLAMIEDAQERLKEADFELDSKVVFIGFSASGTFANRFSLLHPKKVAGIVAGGINGIPMLPVSRLQDVDLPYPLGTSDFENLFDAPFDKESWLQIKQFLFMGELDDNDAVQYDDGYSQLEREIAYSVLGEEMMPTRWEFNQNIYLESGADVIFSTYPDIGHGTNRLINEELVEFIKSID